MSSSDATEDGAPDGESRYNSERKRLMDMLDASASALGEHFDSVRIIAVCSITPLTDTILSIGSGSYYAQLGSVDQWMRDQKAPDRGWGDEDDDDDDDG